MAKPIELKEMRPQFGKFTLEATGEIEHTFRKINIDDEEWVRETFGVLGLEELFKKGSEVKLSDLCRVYHHLLVDKGQFPPEREMFWDDTTAELTERVVPGHRVFMRKISGGDEFKKVADAFIKTLIASRGVVTEEEKKTPKKKAAAPSAGDKSSTFSVTNTDGHPIP